jgi:protein-disulfide isomerase
LQDGNVVATIDGAEPVALVTSKIDKALAGNEKAIANIKLDPISSSDFVLGNTEAKVAIVLYTDFQCPFCGKFFKEVEETLLNNYAEQGKIKFVHRDFAFLGLESLKAAEAARCAGDQNKFWEYHDYLYTHQNGENQGNFSDPNLKSFAGSLKLK